MEIRVPGVVNREETFQGILRIQPIDAVRRSLLVRLALRLDEVCSHDGARSCSYPIEPAEHLVVLEGGWREEIPFSVRFPRKHFSTWCGGVTALIVGDRFWQMLSVEAPIVLRPPDVFDALAQRIGELTGFTEARWTVSAESDDVAVYVARLRRAGAPHALLSGISLELHECQGSHTGRLTVVEASKNPLRSAVPNRRTVSFAEWGLDREIPELEEFLRRYVSETRNLPVPTCLTGTVTARDLPLPDSNLNTDLGQLPGPSHPCENNAASQSECDKRGKCE